MPILQYVQEEEGGFDRGDQEFFVDLIKFKMPERHLRRVGEDKG